MNTPLLTDREENMAPWNQKEPKPIKVTTGPIITGGKILCNIFTPNFLTIKLNSI